MARGRSRQRFLILGCGHTGTTLISGILHINGYGSFRVSRDFENRDLNALNHRILNGQEVSDGEIQRFLTTVEQRTAGQWSLKDPRLSETISQFYRLTAQPVKIIFNYRNPGATVRSLIKDREIYESHLTRDEMLESAEEEWLKRNRAVLDFLDTRNQSPILIIRYDDLVDRKLDEMLCRFVGHSLDLSFIEPSLRHSRPMLVSQALSDLYVELNHRFEANNQDVLRTTAQVRVRRVRGPTPKTRFHVISNRLINGARWRLIRRRGPASESQSRRHES